MEFKVLSSGDLYAYERRTAETEFFWLCDVCASRYDLHLDRWGRVTARARSAVRRALPIDADGKLRLVTRSTRSMPRLETVPAGERATSFGLSGYPFFPDLYFRATIHS